MLGAIRGIFFSDSLIGSRKKNVGFEQARLFQLHQHCKLSVGRFGFSSLLLADYCFYNCAQRLALLCEAVTIVLFGGVSFRELLAIQPRRSREAVPHPRV